ncbi:MAG TPA: prepilin-type N-terminal cleavage/methylation domain-containing protein [Gemmatimonadaceae bacterium]|nr:prepilin-type N-terminal cleavage/methylation domain-containing protein [Gemmatimonadaceae bacterium]
MRAADRRGFTLIELIAGLSIAGLALLGGILLLDQIGDESIRIATARVHTMRAANGARMLRRLILDALPSADTTQGLEGTARAASFRTLCDTPGGWMAPCRVRLLLDQRGDSSLISADRAAGSPLRLLTIEGAAEFRFVDPYQDTLWMTRWSSSLGLPSAMAVVATRDTIVFPLGVMHE